MIANICRLCKKYFCCEKCRIKHEENKHSVYPGCDICVYGRALLKDVNENLAEHIKEKHWPVHCLRCEKLFTSVTEVTSHTLCAVKMEKKETFAEKLGSSGDIHYETPPLSSILHKSILITSKSNYSHGGNVTTSTPMQNINERDMLENIQEIITPVDFLENNDNVKNLNSNINLGITPCITEQSKSSEGNLKRRVTFIETPTEHSTNEHNSTSQTPSGSTKTFATASDSTPLEMLQSPQEEDEFLQVTSTSLGEDDVCWESAIMDPDLSLITIPEIKHTHIQLSKYEDLFGDNIQYKKIDTIAGPSTGNAIWSSMTNLVQSMMKTFTSSDNITKPKLILKRPRSDSDSLNSPARKKIKLFNMIQCRKPIHELKPDFIRYRKKVPMVDKTTQTD